MVVVAAAEAAEAVAAVLVLVGGERKGEEWF